MEFSRQEDEPVIEELVLHTEGREFTDEYKQLTRDFYLAF
jgi:tRNA1(Val) A37 N6-methylase TrmN6